MTKDNLKKAEQLIELAMKALQQLGADAALITVVVANDEDEGIGHILCTHGGLTDDLVATMAIATTKEVLDSIKNKKCGDNDCASCSCDENTDLDAMKQEAIDMMRHQAKNGELHYLSPYTARTKLAKPL